MLETSSKKLASEVAMSDFLNVEVPVTNAIPSLSL